MQLAVTTLILVHLVQGEISKLSKQQLNIINTSASVEKSLSIASVLSVQYVCIEEDIDRSHLSAWLWPIYYLQLSIMQILKLDVYSVLLSKSSGDKLSYAWLGMKIVQTIF